MSTSAPGQSPTPNQVVLPEGVTLGPARETTQTNQQGQVVQGMLFPVTLPNGTTTSVFVPYAMLGSVSQVQAIFDQRINALLAITG